MDHFRREMKTAVSPKRGSSRDAWLLLCALLITSFGPVFAQPTPLPGASQTPLVAPETPITLDQLRIFMQRMHLVESTQKLTMEEAERQRATLPVWFPPAVWDAVEKKIMDIDVAQVELPIYQRYVSRETADALILFLQGPLGDQIADIVLPRRMAVARTGALGSEAEEKTMEQVTQSDLDLGTKRLSQLPPADRQRVIQSRQSIMSIWKPASDELAASYDNLVNSVVHKEIAAHNSELQAAQQAYLRKSASHPSQHH